nr:sulfite exporter TauE/SafE family protein [Salinibius halmophilus]
MFELFVLFIVSLAANTLSSLAGGGAGLLQLPLLLFLGQPFAIALATHKAASVFLGVGASIKHFGGGKINLPLVLTLMLAGIPGVILGANIILAVPELWATAALGILTLALGIYSMVKPSLGQHHNPVSFTLRHTLIGSTVLFTIAVLNGSLTSGTGLFVTMWLIYWWRLDYQHAIAHTMVMVGLLWNGTGAVTLGLQGEINWLWLMPLIAASFLGGWLGAHLAPKAGNKRIKRLFELVTIATGASLLWRVFG